MTQDEIKEVHKALTGEPIVWQPTITTTGKMPATYEITFITSQLERWQPQIIHSRLSNNSEPPPQG